jgi:hypothetical protein
MDEDRMSKDFITDEMMADRRREFLEGKAKEEAEKKAQRKEAAPPPTSMTNMQQRIAQSVGGVTSRNIASNLAMQGRNLQSSIHAKTSADPEAHRRRLQEIAKERIDRMLGRNVEDHESRIGKLERKEAPHPPGILHKDVVPVNFKHETYVYDGPFYAYTDLETYPVNIFIAPGFVYAGALARYYWPQTSGLVVDSTSVTVGHDEEGIVMMNVQVDRDNGYFSNYVAGSDIFRPHLTSSAVTTEAPSIQHANYVSVILCDYKTEGGLVTYLRQRHYGDILCTVRRVHEITGIGSDNYYYCSLFASEVYAMSEILLPTTPAVYGFRADDMVASASGTEVLGGDPF